MGFCSDGRLRQPRLIYRSLFRTNCIIFFVFRVLFSRWALLLPATVSCSRMRYTHSVARTYWSRGGNSVCTHCTTFYVHTVSVNLNEERIIQTTNKFVEYCLRFTVFTNNVFICNKTQFSIRNFEDRLYRLHSRNRGCVHKYTFMTRPCF